MLREIYMKGCTKILVDVSDWSKQRLDKFDRIDTLQSQVREAEKNIKIVLKNFEQTKLVMSLKHQRYLRSIGCLESATIAVHWDK